MVLKLTLQKILKSLASRVIKKYQPKVVVITGSLGKTSTKEAIYQVLAKKFRTRRNLGSYNNEIGVPLTILGNYPGEKSIFKWLKIFLGSLILIYRKTKNYPEILVLEMGASKPGDLKYLLEIIPTNLLKVVILTAIKPCHLEFFGNLENIFREKVTPFSYLPKNNFAVVNQDHCPFDKVKAKISSQLLTYGFSEKADIRAKDIKIRNAGLECMLIYKREKFFFQLKDAISPLQAYPLLGAFGVGICFRLNPKEILSALRNYHILSGRLKKLMGENESWIIDDSYNSSPAAAKEALRALVKVPFGKRKIAILGDMLELGVASKSLHQSMGEIIAYLNLDYLITIGNEAKFIGGRAIEKGFSQEKYKHFNNFQQSLEFVHKLIKPFDVILIKGSRKIKLEKLVREITLKQKNEPSSS